MKKVLLASGNQGKLLELKQLFSGLNIELLAQPNEECYEVEETGSTFVENAIIKARHASLLSGLPAIADDSGLVIEALGGQPGVKTARYAGENADSNENMDLVLKNLKTYESLETRSASFVCVLVFIRSATDPLPLISIGEWNGSICLQKHGSKGFGYDPIFWSFEENKSAAELDLVVKQKYSHRGKAARSLKLQLAGLY
jgi:XTP/dITP diphosphohydrolase